MADAVEKLLYKQRFAELVAADKRLNSTETVEEILNFAILVNALGGDERGCADDLQRVGIRDPISLETPRLFAVEHGENDTTRTKEFGESGNRLLGDSRFYVVENIPQQNGIEGRSRILNVGLYKARSTACGRQVNILWRCGRVLDANFFLGQKVLPRFQQVIGGNTEAAFNEEIERGLPGRPEIEQGPAPETVEVPEKFLQTVGDTSRLIGLRRATRSRYCGGRAPAALTGIATCGRVMSDGAACSPACSDAQFVQKAHKFRLPPPAKKRLGYRVWISPSLPPNC